MIICLVKQITDTINKARASHAVRQQLKRYLLQDRANESEESKLARLESYLRADAPLNKFLSTHNSSFFAPGETNTIKQIRDEIEKLRQSNSLESSSGDMVMQSMNRLPK